MKFFDILYKVTRIFTGILLIIMFFLVLFQVIARYILHLSIAQTDEIARYLLLWVALIGSALAIRTKTHVAVDFVVGKLTSLPKKIISVITYTCIILFWCIILFYGSYFSFRAMNQMSPSMPVLRVGYVLFIFPLAGILGLLFTLEWVLKDFFIKENN